MNISSTISREIRRRASATEVPDAVLYTSPEYLKFCQNTVKTVLKGIPANVTLEFSPDSDVTGYTDGSHIHLNTANSVAQHYSASNGRFLANLGILFHECAHILYSDFTGETAAVARTKAGTLWPQPPLWDDAEMNAQQEELLHAMQLDSNVCQILGHAVKTLQNCIADAHDEAVLCSRSGSLINNGISAAVMSLRAEADALETMIDDGRSPMSIMFSLILQYVRFYDIAVMNEDAWNTEYGQTLTKIKPFLFQSRFTDNTEEKMDDINHILVLLWPYLKAEILKLEQQQRQQSDQTDQSGQSDQSSQSEQSQDGQDQNGQDQNGQSQDGQDQNGQSQPGQGSESSESIESPMSQETMQKIMDQLQEAVQSAGLSKANAAPENRPNNAQRETDTQAEQPDQTVDENAAKNAMETLKNSIAKQMAEQSMEREAAEQLQEDVNKDRNEYQDPSIYVNRVLEIPENAALEYQAEYEKVRTYSKAIQKNLLRVFKERNDDGLVRKSYGPIMRPQEAYRKDGKFFYKKNVPENLPAMSIGVLIDQSGSTNSSCGDETRIGIFRRTAVMLEDVAAGLDIPIMIAGHNESDSFSTHPALHVYVPFERASQKDKYRLMSMFPMGCNRDTLMLDKMADQMIARKEDVRLLFIISDGRPSAGLRGKAAYASLQNTCKRAEKHGIQVFAAGVGEDVDLLKEIYGKRFLDISDFSQLPSALVKLVKRNLLG